MLFIRSDQVCLSFDEQLTTLINNKLNINRLEVQSLKFYVNMGYLRSSLRYTNKTSCLKSRLHCRTITSLENTGKADEFIARSHYLE